MTELVDEVLEAHGGLDTWRAIETITATGRFGGFLSSRFPGNKMAHVDVSIETSRQHAVFTGFPGREQTMVFDRGDVRLESNDGRVQAARPDARRAFTGPSRLRRNLRWDALDAGYFAGYAWWNYLTSPLLLTVEGVRTTEGAAWRERGQTWRTIEVEFPTELHTHSAQQTFYIDPAGLIRRHDYVAEPVGRWAHAAHYCDEHTEFDGLIFPTRRRVVPIGPRGRALPFPTLVSLDIEAVSTTSRRR